MYLFLELNPRSQRSCRARRFFGILIIKWRRTWERKTRWDTQPQLCRDRDSVMLFNVWPKGVGKGANIFVMPSCFLLYSISFYFFLLPLIVSAVLRQLFRFLFFLPNRFLNRAIQLAVDKLFPIHRHVRQLLLACCVYRCNEQREPWLFLSFFFFLL